MGFIPKDYVPVHTRVQKAHDENKTLNILTTHELLGTDTVVFKASVTTEKGTFNGTSFGSINKDKALEKLETVAVGRALAFAGYEIKSGLASKDEMDRFNGNQASEKPMFEISNYDNFVANIALYPDHNKAIATIESKYRLSYNMKIRISSLYLS